MNSATSIEQPPCKPPGRSSRPKIGPARRRPLGVFPALAFGLGAKLLSDLLNYANHGYDPDYAPFTQLVPGVTDDEDRLARCQRVGRRTARRKRIESV
jgi:hypothetical protein